MFGRADGGIDMHEIEMKRHLTRLTAIGLLVGAMACNATDQERFSSQQSYRQMSQTTSTLTAYGATYIAAETERFRCPSISGISSSNNVTVFTAQASAPTPHFTLESWFCRFSFGVPHRVARHLYALQFIADRSLCDVVPRTVSHRRIVR